MAANPAKFERCVRDVKKRGGVGNAYAVCHAAMGNPDKVETLYQKAQTAQAELQAAIDRKESNARLMELNKALHKASADYRKAVHKRNPESTSAAMYESFHGTPSTEIVEVEEREHFHEHLAELGVLVELGVQTATGYEVWLGFGDPDADGESKSNPIWPFGPGQPLGSREYVGHVGKRGRVSKSSLSSVYKGYTVYASGDAFTVPQIDRESRFDTKKDARRFIDQEIKDRRRNGKKRGPISSVVGGVYDTGAELDRQLGDLIGFKTNPLKQLHHSPLVTNASINRDSAVRMMKAGMTPGEIARAFPKVFKTSMEDGREKLGQIYDSEIMDGSGRLETKYTIHREAVDAEIKKHKAAAKKGNPDTYADQAYGSRFQKRGHQWYQSLSFRSPAFKGTGDFSPWEKADKETSQMLDRALKAGKLVLTKSNPEPGEVWEYGYRARKDGKWKTLHAVGQIKSTDATSITFVDGKKIRQGMVEQSGEGLIRKKNPADPLSTHSVMLCSNESGTQLYFIGGDQALDLNALKFTDREKEKESIVIGEAFFISYLTRKDFDKMEEIVYEHDLGEETGVVPTLIYDRLNKRLKLAGGEYYIPQPLFETSGGIHN